MSGDRILILEETPRERMQLSAWLEDMGYNVTSTADSGQAESAGLKHQYRMMIVDVSAPGLSGIDFLKKIKAGHPDTAILFVSKKPLVEEAVSLMRHGAFDFIVKPLKKEYLTLCLQKIWSENSSQSPAQSSKTPKTLKIITSDPNMQALLKMADRVADSSASVLIQGESGTGKELFARYIHEKSSRKEMPFVAVNCAALPEALLESELFGHEKGAFTGAVSRKMGKFELADQGTLFLDEITEMQIHLQAKLLRVLQENVVDRVGGVQPVPVDVRILATTNRDARESIDNNEFTKDLFYRLNTIPLVIPPLRSRIGDIDILSRFFIKKYNKLDSRSVKGLTKEAMDLLASREFDGNVRELENIIHRAVLLSDNELIDVKDLLMDDVLHHGSKSEAPGQPPMEPGSLREMEEKMIFHTLDRTEGNRTHAAKILGISVRTLRNKLNEYKKTESDTL